MDINALRQKRAGLAKEARGILDVAQAADRDMSSDEEQTFDRLMGEADKLERAIEREEKLREQERRIAELTPPSDERNGPGEGSDDEVERAFRQYVVGGRASLSEQQARSLSMGTDPEGGFLVAPQKWVNELIQAIDNDVPLRGVATVMKLTEGESLGVPTLDTDVNDAEWTSEVATGSQDDAMRFGKRELAPNPLAKRIKVSRTLLRRSSLDPEAIVRQRMAYKFGVSQEKAFMTGDGNKKPLGLFTASNQGISTGRDVVVADQSDGAPYFLSDNLIDAKHTLKTGYWKRARWLFHRTAMANIRKLRTEADGQYMWQPGLTSDKPDTILEVPYLVSEYVPNTFTDGAYVGMIGDFSYYWVVDALNFEIQRLVELYAETNQVGFIGRAECDAMPVLEEAFVRLSVRA